MPRVNTVWRELWGEEDCLEAPALALLLSKCLLSPSRMPGTVPGVEVTILALEVLSI